MGDFFGRKSFKILLAVLLVVAGIIVYTVITGSNFIYKGISVVTTPVQKAVGTASDGVSERIYNIFSGQRLAEENEILRAENAQLRDQLVDLETYRRENDNLKQYLEIKSSNPWLEFEPAMVIGRDVADRFYSFTIDKGANVGIEVGDPVITAEGMVGYVSGVSHSSAQVKTILDASVSVGAIDSKTRETGISEGTVLLAEEGNLRISYLSRETSVEVGSLMITSGIGGECPQNLVLGRVEKIEPDSSGLSLYAVVKPFVDIRTVKDVTVITDFS